MYMTVTVEGAARLFLHQVWKLHGLLKCIISDHGPQFIAHFTQELYHLLEIKLASSDKWTDGARQPRVGPVPLAICERMARRLVQPITHSRIPAQQSCLLHHLTASIPAQHQMASLHGLQTLTEPFRSRDSQ